MSIRGEYCKCFVCGATADIFAITQHFNNCDFTEALRILGGDQGSNYNTFMAAAKREAALREKIKLENKLRELNFREMDEYYKLTEIIKQKSGELVVDALQDEEFLQAVEDLSSCGGYKALWTN
jgi:DNA primase